MLEAEDMLSSFVGAGTLPIVRTRQRPFQMPPIP